MSGLGAYALLRHLYFQKIMKTIKVDKKKALANFIVRANQKQAISRELLSQNGIVTAGAIRVQDLKNLAELNRPAFNMLIENLYPEIFVANAGNEEDGTAANAKGGGLDDTTKKGLFDLFGGLITSAGSVLTGIYGNGNNSGNVSSDIYAEQLKIQQEQQAKTRKYIIIAVCVLAVAGIAVALFMNRNKIGIVKA